MATAAVTSAVFSKNNNDPTTKPCDTPHTTDELAHIALRYVAAFILVLIFLFFKIIY